MNNNIQTPIAQAMQEGIITRGELKKLMARSNIPALLRLVLWLGMLGLTSSIIWLTSGGWMMLPAMLLHGIVLVHHFSLQHECCHYTAFKTRWLNDAIGNVCALIIMLPHRFFRYEHCDHHTYTQLKGKDTELIELPESLSGYFFYLSSIPYWQSKLQEMWRHCRGHLSDSDKRFVPREEYKTITLEARIMALIYLCVFAASIWSGSTTALWYWLVPVVLGEPVMRAIRMTEHMGKPTVHDMRVNTRSNHVAWPMRFLCWNMNYHAEHHYASSVPFHALPALSNKLNGLIQTEHQGYIGAHKDIVSQLLGKKRRCDDIRQ